MPTAAPLLEARRVYARHPRADRDAVRDLSLQVFRGEILALVGPNGSGKSTTLQVLGRGLRPREGEVLLDGTDLHSLSRRALARRLARLPQSPACPEGVIVDDLVLFGRHVHRQILSAPNAADREAVSAALEATDLGDLRRRRVETLSGGERRRAWLAMVLAQQAEILLLDEPTAALDLRHQHQVLELLERVNQERGTTIVIVLHDLAQAARIADRVALMYRGRLYQAGPPKKCLDTEALRDVFGIDAQIDDAGGRFRLDVLGVADPIRRL